MLKPITDSLRILNLTQVRKKKNSNEISLKSNRFSQKIINKLIGRRRKKKY